MRKFLIFSLLILATPLAGQDVRKASVVSNGNVTVQDYVGFGYGPETCRSKIGSMTLELEGDHTWKECAESLLNVVTLLAKSKEQERAYENRMIQRILEDLQERYGPDQK